MKILTKKQEEKERKITDVQKAFEIRNYVREFFIHDVSHILLSTDNESVTRDDINKRWVNFYTSGDFVSLEINDTKNFIKYEITISDSGIDLKTLRNGNFKDMQFPDLDVLFSFIKETIENNKDFRWYHYNENELIRDIDSAIKNTERKLSKLEKLKEEYNK